MTKTGWAIGLLTIAIALAVGFWSTRGKAPDALEARVVPLGETTVQWLPGADGQPEGWTLSKREVDPSDRAVDLLPQASPRSSSPDERTDSARALNAQALEAWKTGRIQDALAFFESALAADPDDWVPRSDYGRLLVMMTDYAKAGPVLERAAELNPDSARVWIDLYSYYQRSQQFERGFEARARAIDLAGGEEIVQDETGLWRLESDSIYP